MMRAPTSFAVVVRRRDGSLLVRERAMLEGGTRTATLRALTKCKVAVARADQVDRTALEELSRGHRREEK